LNVDNYSDNVSLSDMLHELQLPSYDQFLYVIVYIQADVAFMF